MAIAQILAQILAAKYGKDVRQAIHDGIEECYSDVSTAKTLAEEAALGADEAAERANLSGFNPRGDYNPDAIPPYSIPDIVYYNGGSFRYINPVPSNAPTSSTSHWQQIAEKGETGATGPTGPKGDTGDPTSSTASDIPTSTAGVSVQGTLDEHASHLLTKLTLGVGKNIFDKATCTDGYSVKTSALNPLNVNAAKSVSDWIAVISGETLVWLIEKIVDGTSLDAGVTVQWTNAAKDTLVGYASPTGPVVVPAGVAYMRFSFTLTFKDYVQVERASVPTPYEGHMVRIDGSTYMPLQPLERSGFLISVGKGTNLYDKNSALPRYSISNVDGSESYSVTRISGTFMLVKGGHKYTVSASTATQAQGIFVHWYTEAGVWISATSYATGGSLTFLAPTNAAYARLETNKVNTLIQFEEGESATTYAEYVEGYLIKSQYVNGIKGNDLYYYPAYWRGKKLAIDGDSISHDQSLLNYWQYVVAQNLKMSLLPGTFTGSDALTYTIGTRGIGGSRIAYGTEQNAIEYCICRRYQYLPDTADLVIIFGGTNDWAHSGVPLGMMADRTDATFYGAMHVLCLGLLSKFPSKQIMFVTPIKRTAVLDDTNSLGLKLVQFADAIIDVCGYYGIPVYDAFRKCTLNPAIADIAALYFLTDDTTHPNAAGQKRLGDSVTGQVKTLAP